MFIFIPYFSCYSELVKSIKLTKFLVPVSSPIYRFLFHWEGKVAAAAGSGHSPMVTGGWGLPGKMVKQDVKCDARPWTLIILTVGHKHGHCLICVY